MSLPAVCYVHSLPHALRRASLVRTGFGACCLPLSGCQPRQGPRVRNQLENLEARASTALSPGSDSPAPTTGCGKAGGGLTHHVLVWDDLQPPRSDETVRGSHTLGDHSHGLQRMNKTIER